MKLPEFIASGGKKEELLHLLNKLNRKNQTTGNMLMKIKIIIVKTKIPDIFIAANKKKKSRVE